MTVEYLDLSDFLAIAAEATGLDVVTITKVTNLNLADSALHAPAAGFGDVDLYPDFVADCGAHHLHLRTRVCRTSRRLPA